MKKGLPRKLAVWFILDSMTCRTASSCEVNGTWHAFSLMGSGETYYLKKQDGKWKVVRFDIHWVS